MVAKYSASESSGDDGDGVEVLKNEPYEENDRRGQYTQKVYHLARSVICKPHLESYCALLLVHIHHIHRLPISNGTLMYARRAHCQWVERVDRSDHWNIGVDMGDGSWYTQFTNRDFAQVQQIAKLAG